MPIHIVRQYVAVGHFILEVYTLYNEHLFLECITMNKGDHDNCMNRLGQQATVLFV